MKSKKLISLLCAAAMSASAFAGLTVTASAATDLFTFTDGSTTGWTMANGTVTQKSDDDGDAYLELQGSGSGNRTATYSLGTSISGEYTIEYDTMMIRGNGMGRIMHTNQIAFTNDTATNDTRDGAGIVDAVNAQQGTNYKSGAGSAIANAALKTDLRPYLTDKWMINDDVTSDLVAYPENAVAVADSKWVRVQAAVNDNKTTVTVIDKAGNKLVDGVEYTNSGNAINSIYVCSNRGDGGSGLIDLDNIHIYQGAPEALTTDGLRGDATVVVPTAAPVMPTPAVKAQAPGLTAPEGVTTVVNNTFSKALASTAMGETDTTITDVDGLSIAMKSRTGGDTGTTVSVADWAAGDKTLTLIGGPYSGAGRGPVVSAVDSLEVADGKSSVMTFAVNLGSNKGGGAGRLYILKDNSQAGSTKDGAYNNVMGVLTTDDTASSYTIGSDSNVVTIGQKVEAYEWYKVAVIVSSDKFRIWVAKADEDFTEKPQVDCDHVGTGDTASSVTALPLLAVTSEKGGSYTGSVARIDNMLTYTGTADQPRKLLPTTEAAPTPAPIPAKVTMSVDETANTVTLTSDKDTDAVLVQASYRTDNTLDSVKKVVNVTLTAGTAYTVPAADLAKFTKNDKIMVWDSLKTMTPLASAYTVKNGDAQATAKPAPTAEPTATPEVTVAPTATAVATSTPVATVVPTATATPTAEPTATPTVKPTATPTAEPTATPTADPTVTVATLNHTAHSQWGRNEPAGASADNELEYFNGDADSGWAAVAYMDFDISNIDADTLYSAELTYKATSGKPYTSAMYYLTGDVDLTTGITGVAADRFATARKAVNSTVPSVKDGVTLKQDVSDAVAARKADSKTNVIFALTGNSGGANLYGKASTDAPTLVAKKGVPVTFTVTAGEDAKVANAEISVKSGNDVVKTATTDENGTATIVLLPSTAYTYTVTSDSYAIKKDVALTTTTESSAVPVALDNNVATTVEIANPATGTTLAQGEEATYTATVKDQDGRVMTATVDWTVVNGEDATAENITVANGKVTVAEAATAGDYKVKATVNGTTVSATADLKVIAAEKLNLSITSQNAEQGTVAYTVNGVESTDTQLNKGKAIVATATPAALYEFAGWATSAENAKAGTYVSKDAQYSFDLTADTTLIAVFKYTGIYYQNDYNNATESDWVSGNTGRYTVSIAGDDDKYTQISAVGTGDNGTSITSSAVQVGADKDYIAEFDLALTGGNNQLSGFAVKAKDSKKYALVLQLKAANTTTWTVNGTTDVTLEKGVLYHYTIEKVETGVKVTIAPTAGGDAVVDGVTYANDTATTGEFAGKVSNAGLAGMQFNTKRYYAGMQIDNVLVKAPATTSVTE